MHPRPPAHAGGRAVWAHYLFLELAAERRRGRGRQFSQSAFHHVFAGGPKEVSNFFHEEVVIMLRPQKAIV